MNYKLIRCAFLWVILAISTLSNATVFNNTAPITINDNAPASIYPSAIEVSSMFGNITSVSVKINALNHNWVHDVSIILQAPTGESLLLQSGTAEGQAASNLTYSISDAGISQFSSLAIWLNNGTYKPTSYFWDIWAAPAPLTPPGIGTYNAPGPFGPQTATFASTFNGHAPNGTWKLFVADFASGDVGLISGGWSLDISSGAPLALNLKTFFASRMNGENRLAWETTNENQFSHFEVEYSKDNAVFSKIAEVNGRNNHNDLNLYSYSHINADAVDNYYRLKMIDEDLYFNYSKTVHVHNGRQDNGIIVYPTIVHNEFMITSQNEPISKVTLHDYSGREVFSANPDAFAFVYLRSAAAIRQGLYIVSIYGNEYKLKTSYLYFE